MTPDPLLDLAANIVFAHSAAIVLDDDTNSAVRFWQNFMTEQELERERAAEIAQTNIDAADLAGSLNTFENIFFGRDDIGFGANF